MEMIFVTIAFMATVMLMMAVGVIFKRPPLKGSCGGVGTGDCVCLEDQLDEKRRQLAASGLEKLQSDGVIIYGVAASASTELQ